MNNVSRKFIAIFLFLNGFAIQAFCMDPPKPGDDLDSVESDPHFRAIKNLELDQSLENAQRIVDTVKTHSDASESFKLLNQLGYIELSLKAARRLIDTIEVNLEARTTLELFINFNQPELVLETAELVVATIETESQAKNSFNLLSELGSQELSDRAIKRFDEIKKQLSVTKENIKTIRYLTHSGINNLTSRAMQISLHISQILLSANKEDFRERTIEAASNNLQNELDKLTKSFRNESIENLVALTQCFMVLGNMDAAALSFFALRTKPNEHDFMHVVISEFPEFEQFGRFQSVPKLLARLISHIDAYGSSRGKDFIPEAILITYDEIIRRGNFYATLGNERAD